MKTACFVRVPDGPGHSARSCTAFVLLDEVCHDRHALTVFGYAGKQVRDQIHSQDLVSAFDHFYRAPRAGEVYNIGGGRFCNCSVREAIALCEEIAGKKLEWRYAETNRTGDHIWWISDTSKFSAHFPGWRLQYDLRAILVEIFENNTGRWV